jgi:hypothetical protein
LDLVDALLLGQRHKSFEKVLLWALLLSDLKHGFPKNGCP